MEAKQYNTLSAGAKKRIKIIQMFKVAVIFLILCFILNEITVLKQSVRIKQRKNILINLTIQKEYIKRYSGAANLTALVAEVAKLAMSEMTTMESL